ncbi:MAG: GNAT family N-acetyltransferase [Halolamina sp.]
MDDVRIRTAAPDDAEALAAAYRDAYRESREFGFPMKAEEATAGEVEVWIRDHRVFVAEAEGTIVGGVRLEAAGDDTLQLSRLAVREGWKGMGIGSRLLKHAERAAREDGYGSMRLTTPENHPYLVEFYRSRGYAVVGDYPLEYREYDEVVLEKRLG